MPTNPHFILTRATINDIPYLTASFVASFNSPFRKRLCAGGPALRQWATDATCAALADAGTYFMVVRDSTDPHRKPIASARWVAPYTDASRPGPQEQYTRWPDFCEGWDVELAGALFGAVAESREREMGRRPHWFLEWLATDEEYKGQGAASLLLKYGCDLADEDGVEAYLDSSPAGRGLYEKFGFVKRAEKAIPGGMGYVEWFMVRPAVGKKSV